RSPPPPPQPRESLGSLTPPGTADRDQILPPAPRRGPPAPQYPPNPPKLPFEACTSTCASGSSSMKRDGMVDDHEPWMRRFDTKEIFAPLRAPVRPTGAGRRPSSRPAPPPPSSGR